MTKTITVAYQKIPVKARPQTTTTKAKGSASTAGAKAKVMRKQFSFTLSPGKEGHLAFLRNVLQNDGITKYIVSRPFPIRYIFSPGGR